MSQYHPYAERFPVNRSLPAHGRDRAEIVAELAQLAAEEDKSWEAGTVSGSYYCGDHDNYAFLGEVFAKFAHVNALQRDVCPSATRFEGEIIAMTLDLFHADAVTDTEPAGIVTSGGTGSILHGVLAHREWAASVRGVTRPNLVRPETAHPAFTKAAHLFGVEVRTAPIDPTTTLVDVDAMAGLIDDQTIMLIGSAGNYGYGTIDPIDRLSDLALARGVGLHVDGCLGGFILPWGEQLGYDIPPFDFRHPGVTSISADTHKYGYGFKGSSVCAFRDKAMRNSLYFFQTDWSGGKYFSPGIDGSRSNGLLASTWAAMVSYGQDGYREHAKAIFETAFAMQDAVRSHPELIMMGTPTFCFSFRSDEFDIYHVNDFMRTRGWRFNGQQYPNSIHMAVTGPQTQPGVVDRFRTDLADAVPYAIEHRDQQPRSAAIYGGVPGGLTPDADEFIQSMMGTMLDQHQSIPKLADPV